jgi:hypothetical protein
MWVASFSDLPLYMRHVISMERVGTWRRLGKLEYGKHYLTLEEAQKFNLQVTGLNPRIGVKQRFVYNPETLFEFFKDKTYTTRKPR